MLKNKTQLAALLAFTALQSQAHQIWIEQDASGARVHLGEFADNLRESSPGMLDKFNQLSARVVTAQGERAVELSKQANAFALAARASTGESLIAQELGYPSWERKQGEKIERHVWLPAARWVGDLAARQPSLSLDLVPTGKANEFQVFFKGQPLPEAKVEVVAASGWSRAVQADTTGRLSITLPWKSAYALEVKHTDHSGGERAGQKFDVGQYVTTLSFSLAQGLAPLPLPAPGTPAK
ncbi:MAG: cobalt ABC transporter substrate-binding protein [Burkholderiales bacterium PBB2]|nr:MAG: cobalt ABC transporter substrate-binding protein [Burkholderiales bacterium PBB2]